MKAKILDDTEVDVGSWVFCKFELAQIKEIKGNEITKLSDGENLWSGVSLNKLCVSLTLPRKYISRIFAGISDELGETRCVGLNRSVIRSKLLTLWVRACLEDGESSRGLCNEAERFWSEIKKYAPCGEQRIIGGISLFEETEAKKS